MKTRTVIFGILSALAGFSSLVGEELYPLVTAKLTTSNEAGEFMPGVEIRAYCHVFPDEVNAKDVGFSDEKGLCSLELRALGFIDVVAKKDGYYPSIARSDKPPRDERFRFDPFIYRDDVPRIAQKDPPMKKEVKLEASITLREIKNPIPLFVKRVRMDIPARDIWLDYDMEAGEWVKPYGQGVRADMRIRSAPKRLDPKVPHGVLLPGVASLEIDFGKHGGLIRVTKENGWLAVSEMKMPHLAPEAGYEQLPILKIEQTTFEDSSESVKANDSYFLPKANGYFFRTRVKREGGKIVSANYGKLMGRINYVPVQREGAWWGDDKKNAPAFGSIEFTYYLNPAANDLNLEFDVKKNLFKRSEQWIRQP